MLNENNGKIDILVDTIVGEAEDRKHKSGCPRIGTDYRYSELDEGVQFLTDYLEARQTDVVSGNRENTDEKAFDKDGNLRVEMTVRVGNSASKQLYTEVTEDGFYVYPSAKDMDERNRDAAQYAMNAEEAMNIHRSMMIDEKSPTKLTVKVISGISSDGFETVVTKGDNTIYERRYNYGYSCSYDKTFAEERTPYVSDVLQSLIDEYQVNDFSVEAGKNVFAGKDVRSETVENFKNEYCSNLQLIGSEQDFTAAVESIPTNEEGLEQ